MFILRRVTGKSIGLNKFIGDEYSVTHREHHAEEFKKLFSATMEPDSESDVYAFVSFNYGEVQALYYGQGCFIMTSGGKTFENISYRGTRPVKE